MAFVEEPGSTNPCEIAEFLMAAMLKTTFHKTCALYRYFFTCYSVQITQNTGWKLCVLLKNIDLWRCEWHFRLIFVVFLECFDNYHKTLNKIVFVRLQDPSFVVLGYVSVCPATKKVKIQFITSIILCILFNRDVLFQQYAVTGV